ncbi:MULTISPECIES: iron chelate uptake ABC transporter family permease subunit [Halomonadaceae]|uniref:iron chelate uptake ABC transporter family permease subunit n=1 Tax=Halomonadaceae TaxID=28256 RepID=UPI0012F046A3|nr:MULTISPECIES: iron chelate uptake ABC transporter family permease subunit [Halomonas]CAD5263074.1 Ferric-anguibactin transport system permease protein FatC [Halomonas sp. 113]CAD5265039.1 Ferric-anguibactin transport system permease protein FatC [Halomonas sp. 59]CAD5277873.1 Ferric-anguibactin transport system permease protein FatC [Halomonas sp. I3]CAD5285129.1 Ferric-anguibactin transport system permease protein FatC [Halomonas sp. 156]VXB52461.1 Ferric-anguibactin transport system perme
MTVKTRHTVWIAVVALALAFVFVRSGFDFAYVIPKRLERLATMVIGGICVAWSAITFQSLTGNRILTPAIMGYEAVYLLFQALLMLILGTRSLLVLGEHGNVALSILLMLGYSWTLHRWLFKDGRDNVYFLLLVGLVLTMVITTFTQFVQLKMSPGEFSILMGYSQASFGHASATQLLYATLIVATLCLVGLKSLPMLDVLLLGREQAISLGIDYRRCVQRQLLLIAALVAVSTSLLGPTAFMGIFVANTAYALAGTYRHRVTLPLGCAIAIALFILAQLLVEHIFNYTTTVGILVNLVCGAYFLSLMVRKRGAA